MACLFVCYCFLFVIVCVAEIVTIAARSMRTELTDALWKSGSRPKKKTVDMTAATQKNAQLRNGEEEENLKFRKLKKYILITNKN